MPGHERLQLAVRVAPGVGNELIVLDGSLPLVFAVALGAGMALPFTERLGTEVMAKGLRRFLQKCGGPGAVRCRGRRAHTLLLVVSARLGL